MKIRVSMKDPDTMQDAVEEAFKHAEKPEGITDEEWEPIREARALEAQQEISSRWMPYGEYLYVEFDTEAGTATVLPAKEFR